MRYVKYSNQTELKYNVTQRPDQFDMNTPQPPAVTIIIPTYNRAHTIRRAIRSALSQGIDDIEILIVDDCSSDDTESAVNEFSDRRIRYIRLDTNQGASFARNAGANAASGKYLAFLDSDDEWLGDMLVTQLRSFANTPDCEASITGFIRFYSEIPEYIHPPASGTDFGHLVDLLLLKNFVTPQTLMITRSCFNNLGGFDVSLSHREDWDFGIRLLLSKKKLNFTNTPLALVYETPGNLSSKEHQKIATLEQFIEKHRTTYCARRNILANHYYHIGHFSILFGDIKKGRKNLFKSFHQHPTLRCLAALSFSALGTKGYKFARATLGLRNLT